MVTKYRTEAQIRQQMQKLRAIHSDKRGNQELDDRMYNQDTSVVRPFVPKDIEIFQSSLATDVVDAVSDVLITDEPVVDYKATGIGDSANRFAAKMQRRGAQILKMDREEAEDDPYAQAGLDLVLRGEAVIKRLHNPNVPLEPTLDEFKTREAYEHAHAAWKVEMGRTDILLPAIAIDPLNVFFPANTKRPPFIIEYQERTQVDMEEKYPEWFNQITNGAKIMKLDSTRREALNKRQLRDDSREIEVLHFWSNYQYHIVADGIPVINDETPNPYTFPPYIHSYSGLGRRNRDSNSANRAASLLSKIRGEVQSEMILKTIQWELSKLYSMPRVLVPRGSEDEVAAGMQARGIITYDPDHPLGPNQIQWLESQPITPAVADFLSRVDASIARRVNPIMRGMGGENSADFGVLEALRLGQATKGTGNIAANLSNMGTESVRMGLRIQQVLGLDATVYGDSEKEIPDATLTAKQIKHTKNFTVTFENVDPVEQTRRHQSGMTLWDKRAISKKTLHEKYLHDIVDDPTEEDLQQKQELGEEVYYSSEEFKAQTVQTMSNQVQTEQMEFSQQRRGGGGGGQPTLSEGQQLDAVSQGAGNATPANDAALATRSQAGAA